MLRKFFRKLAVGRTVSALNQLSDRELKDIGLNRGDIRRVAREMV